MSENMKRQSLGNKKAKWETKAEEGLWCEEEKEECDELYRGKCDSSSILTAVNINFTAVS